MVRNRSVLLIHHRNLRSPYSATVPHYLARKFSDSHRVHVLCRGGLPPEYGKLPDDVVVHDINPGSIPVLSELLFVLLSTLYAAVLGSRYRYDAVYGYQRTVVQAWVGAVTGRARYIIGLQVVPVRQEENFIKHAAQKQSITDLLASLFRSVYRLVIRFLLTRATEIICLTAGIRDITEREYGIDLSESHVIGMGVDTGRFSTALERDSEPSFTEPLTITYVGSIADTRGFRHVIDGLAETDRDVRFRVAGDGKQSYIQEMKRKATRLGVDENIEWLGRIPHDEVPTVLAQTDIALSPLLDIESYRISFPAKVLEYMAGGTVVLATDITAHRQLIDDGVNGLVYQCSGSDLCGAFRRILEDIDNREEIERAARQTAENYDWSVVVYRYERVVFGFDDDTDTLSSHDSSVQQSAM